MTDQQHSMELVREHADGFEEWYCPTCGRRFLMHWPPEYEKTIITPGNEMVTHAAGKGLPGLEMNMGQAEVSQKEPGVEPFAEWMERVGESLWEKGEDGSASG